MKGEAKTKKELMSELAGMLQRITDLEKSKLELAHTKELLQEERETFFPILHKAPYGVVLIDRDGRFLYINPEFTRMTGYTMADTHAERDWFHTATVFAEYSREVLTTWKTVILQKGIEKVLTVICKDGEIKEIEFKPTLLDDKRIIVMLSDVTERKRTEKELEKYRAHLEERVADRTAELRTMNEKLQREIVERKRVEGEVRKLNEDLTRRATELEAANKELQAFGYSVSHDLRAPLIGIQGLSRILLERYAGQLDVKGQHVLSVIQRDTQKMSQLIDNLIALSRFEHQEVKPSDVDMGEIANAVFEEIRSISPDIPQDSLQFKLEPLPPSYGDPVMIRQVFFNLLSNAIKFSRPKQIGVVELGCMTGENQNTYYIKDNGVGFDMQHASKLFGVFQRLHTSHEFQGTGIGLAIVQRIIHRQGGKVWAEAEVGKGATFYFTLPKGRSTIQPKG